jgi:hypothetical protein
MPLLKKVGDWRHTSTYSWHCGKWKRSISCSHSFSSVEDAPECIRPEARWIQGKLRTSWRIQKLLPLSGIELRLLGAENLSLCQLYNPASLYVGNIWFILSVHLHNNRHSPYEFSQLQLALYYLATLGKLPKMNLSIRWIIGLEIIVM